MSMLQKFGTGTRKQGTKNDGAGESIIYSGGEYSNEIPNTEPTDTRTGDTPWTSWKAKYYSTTRQRNLGAGSAEAKNGSQKADGTSVVDDTTNKWYNTLSMLKLKKILKRYTKYNDTNMSA